MVIGPAMVIYWLLRLTVHLGRKRSAKRSKRFDSVLLQSGSFRWLSAIVGSASASAPASDSRFALDNVRFAVSPPQTRPRRVRIAIIASGIRSRSGDLRQGSRRPLQCRQTAKVSVEQAQSAHDPHRSGSLPEIAQNYSEHRRNFQVRTMLLCLYPIGSLID